MSYLSSTELTESDLSFKFWLMKRTWANIIIQLLFSSMGKPISGIIIVMLPGGFELNQSEQLMT